LRAALALCAVVVWTGGAGAAELPSRAAKGKAPEKARYCEIGGARGVLLENGTCVRVGGYVSVGVGSVKH
jgi:hypothetical protein